MNDDLLAKQEEYVSISRDLQMETQTVNLLTIKLNQLQL
jgi:hypothetical protein